MTQPDELFPDDAANAGSFASFAGKTQEEWEAEQRGAEVARWSPLSALSDVFIIGDIIEIITGVEDGDLNDLGTWVNNLDELVLGFINGIVEAITGVVDGTLDTLGQWFNDLLAFLGGPSVGPGQAGGPSAAEYAASLQELMGLLGTEQPVPKSLLAELAMGRGTNTLPDSTFAKSVNVDGQGLWIWDRPGRGGLASGSGCVRTRRPGTVTLFHVIGSVHIELLFGLIDINGLPTPPDLMKFILGTAPLDFTHIEWVNVPYPAKALNEMPSKEVGVANLVAMIKATPGPFMFAGESQGAWVISDVYDLLRQGFYINPDGTKIVDTSIMDRRDDLIMGLSIANPRRQQGRAWPGGPLYGDGEGVVLPTLSGTEDLWWEWSVGEGTFPSGGELDGTVYPVGDTVSMCPPGAEGNYVRSSPNYELIVGAPFDGPPGEATPLAQAHANNLLLPGEPHSGSFAIIQPWLADGDERTFLEIAVDAANTIATTAVNPPTIGLRHQLEGVATAVQPFQRVTGGAYVEWVNVVADGPAIMVAVNAYDADNRLIATVTADDATVTNPQASSNGWRLLEASFVMPAGAATAKLLFNVEPAACTTGTVWFDDAKLEVASIVDSSLLGNIANIPQLSAESVAGPQGVANMLTALQNAIDGLASANTGNDLTGVELAEMLSSAAKTALDASLALELGIANNAVVNNNTNQPQYNGLQPTGEVTFPITSLTAGATLPDFTIEAGTSFIGFINISKTAKKGFIEFIGEGIGGTGVYVNVYDVDKSTGDFTLLWASDDISASVPNGSFGWVSVIIPTEDQFTVTGSQLIALEIVAEDTDVIVAAQSIAIPNHPTTIPQNIGATRITSTSGGESPSSIDSSDITYGGDEPFIEFGITNIPSAYNPPNQESFTVAGTFTYDIPDWIEAGDSITIVAVGAGGGAAADFFGGGAGGAGGSWAVETLQYGTDIPGSTTQLTVQVGAGGTTSASGGNSVVSGAGMSTITAAGGAGAVNADGSGTTPGNKVVAGRTYFGGQTVARGSHPGNTPGGGGSAGAFLGGPGLGAPGGVWITARQEVDLARETTAYTAPGNYAFTIPAGANYLDFILLGAGGSGASYADETAGGGGKAGAWTTATLTKDAFPPGGVVDVVVGAGGSTVPSIALDDVGDGYQAESLFPGLSSGSFSYTATEGAAVVLMVAVGSGGVSSAFGVSATYGGRQMTPLGVMTPAPFNGPVALLGLLDAGTGNAETVEFTLTQGGVATVTANCVSYINVGGFGTVSKDFGTPTKSPSLILEAEPDQVVVAAVHIYAPNLAPDGDISGFNHDTLYSASSVDVSGSSLFHNVTLLGEAPGAASVALSVTTQAGGIFDGGTWSIIAVPLLPKYYAINGTAGSASSVSATGMTTYEAPGGARGELGAGVIVGASPNSKTYNNTLYTGGANQTVGSRVGNAPGGGGSGGAEEERNGGAGSSGAVWIVARQ